MPASSAPLTDRQPERFRLFPKSIRGLMGLTLFAATVFTYHGQAWGATISWQAIAETAFLTISWVIACGLLQQAWCLWRFRSSELNTGDEPVGDSSSDRDQLTELRQLRFGALVGVVSRVVVALLLVAMTMLRGFVHPESAYGGPAWLYSVRWIWEPLLPIWLMVALGFTRQAKRVPRPARWGGKLVSWIAGGASLVLVLFLIGFAFAVPFLMFIACRGIELSRARIHSPMLPHLDQDVMRRIDPAFGLTWAAVAALGIAAWALWRNKKNAWAESTADHRRRCAVYLILATVATIACWALVLWNVSDALPRATPWLMGESFRYSPAEIVANGIPLLFLITFVLVLRATRRPALSLASGNPFQTSRIAPAVKMPICWHERLGVLWTCIAMLFVFTAIAFVDAIEDLLRMYTGRSGTGWSDSIQIFRDDPLILVELLIIDPFVPGKQLFVFVACLAVAIVIAWRGRKKSISNYPVSITNYGQPARFLLVLLIITSLVIIAAPLLSLAGFMMNALHFYL